MARFGRMDEERGRAGAGERGRELAGHMAGFADARDDDASAAAKDEVDRLDETIVELIAKRAHGVRFDVEHVASERECPVAIDFRYHSRSIAKAFVRRAGRGRRCPAAALTGPSTLSHGGLRAMVMSTNQDALQMISPLEMTLFLLLASVAGVVIFRFLNLPPMLGYLSGGYRRRAACARASIPDSQGAQNLAEFGVVFLMFSIGLEFSLAKLRSMRRLVFGLGLLQVIGTIAVARGCSVSCWSAGCISRGRRSIALGGALAMSSTAIVSKMLAERLETRIRARPAISSACCCSRIWRWCRC